MALVFDAKKNFAYSVVATAPSPAASGTTLIVAPGDGAKFPAAPFNAVVWPSGVQPTTTNAEVVRVTAKSVDTLTIVRAQESSSARTIVANDQIAQNITAKSLTDIENAITTAGQTTAPVGAVIMWTTNSAPTGWTICDGSAINRTTFSELFAVIGTTFGTGDGSTTFNVPNMQERIPIGKSATTAINAVGNVAGSWDHTHGPGSLTVASHTHGPGTLQVQSHTHTSGSLQVASHTHGPGTLSTDTQATSHSHTLSSHTHTLVHTHTFSATTSDAQSNNFNNAQSGVSFTASTFLHTHTVSGTTAGASTTTTSTPSDNATSFVTQTHSHTVNAGLTASTAPSVNSGVTGGTAPLLDAGVSAGTAPAVNAGVTAAGNPPVLVYNYIIRSTSVI